MNIKNSRKIKTFPITNEQDRLAILSLVRHGSVVRVKNEMLPEICSEVPESNIHGGSMKNLASIFTMPKFKRLRGHSGVLVKYLLDIWVYSGL